MFLRLWEHVVRNNPYIICYVILRNLEGNENNETMEMEESNGNSLSYRMSCLR